MDQAAQDPALEARVGRLELDMHDVKSTLGRLEPLIVSIHAQMPYLATKAELEQVRGELGALRADMQTQIEGLRADLEAKIAGLRADLKIQIESLRADLEIKIAAVRADMEVKDRAIRADLEVRVEQLRTEMRAGFAEKPGIIGMWVMGATLLGLVVAAFAAGAAWLPMISRALHTGP